MLKNIRTLCIIVECQHLQCLGIINNVKKTNKHVSEIFVVNNYCLCNNVVTTHFMVVIVFKKGLQKLIYGDACFINGNIHKNYAHQFFKPTITTCILSPNDHEIRLLNILMIPKTTSWNINNTYDLPTTNNLK